MPTMATTPWTTRCWTRTWAPLRNCAKLVDTAHSQGIRILFDIVMNHPGYLDIQTAKDLENRRPVAGLGKGSEPASELSQLHRLQLLQVRRLVGAALGARGPAWLSRRRPGRPHHAVGPICRNFSHGEHEFVKLPKFLRRRSTPGQWTCQHHGPRVPHQVAHGLGPGVRHRRLPLRHREER